MRADQAVGIRRTALGIAAIIVGIAVAFTVFYYSNVRRIAHQNENYIADIATQRASLMEDIFDENLSYIESAAIVLETEFEIRDVRPELLNTPAGEDPDPVEVDKVAAILRDFESRFAFDFLRFIDLRGRDYTSGEKTIAAIVTDREYYQQGILGQTGMTYILDSKVTSQRQIGFYSPVRVGGEVVGVAVGFFGEEYIHRLLTVSLFEHECDVLLCDREGTVIYNTVMDGGIDNFLADLKTLSFSSPEDLLRVSEAFRASRDALFGYRVDGQDTVGCLRYVGSNSDFFLVVNFPPDAYRSMIFNANANGLVLLIMLIALFAAAAILYLVHALIQRRRLLEETKNSNDIHFAMSRLFENFVRVNAAARSYHYIEGMPDVGHIPNDGMYDLFLNDLLSRFPNEAEREGARSLINLDHLLDQMNRGANIVSYNLHAPIREEEWFTYNFIVVSRDDEGRVKEFLIARQDITKLQEKEEEIRRILERARDEAEKGSRAKTAFLSSMSHDIRTPMNAIIGYTNIALDHIDDTEMVKDFLGKIASSGQYLLSLINDVLDMSKIESGKVQLKESDCDLRDVIQRVADVTRTQASSKHLNITFDLDALSHPLVTVDELRLEQVLINITGNAVKYTPEGGSIAVTAREEDVGAEDRRRYVFSVKDTGIGISPDYLPHIFESFSRETTSTINKIQGTGLGMAITARLVRMMGGSIVVTSELNAGSEFVVTLELPCREAEPEREIAPEADADAIDLNGRRVLLVEDNDINAEIAGFVLSGYGVVVERAANGLEGLKRLQDDPDGFDAVLMDIQMPVMNGYEATRAIRALPDPGPQSIPIIAMSANAYEEDIRESLDSGMNGHIAKPFDPDTLALELQRQIRTRG